MTSGMRLTTRLLLFVFLSVIVPMIGLSLFLKQEITESILGEKRDKLFGLARQLDKALTGSFDEILASEGALDYGREDKIAVLNARLRSITDFVASGNDGVGVGYYGRELDAVLTYGPSGEFQYMVGKSIFEGHQGYEVMASGKPMVQTGALVRGDILNCMWPISRDGLVIGYIWSNETLDKIGEQLDPIVRRMYLIDALIFFLIYVSVAMTMKGLLDRIVSIKKGIDVLFHMPNYHIPPVSGELSLIVNTINDLVDTTNIVKCYNKNILESVLNGVLAVSCSGEITRANKAFFELFPELDDSIIGGDYRRAFPPDMATVVAKGLGGDGSGNASSGGIAELKHDGKVIEVYGNTMFDETGSRLGAVFFYRDITVMRRYERELQEKDRAAALGEMALAVVHEVRNPMTSVKGFAQLLRRPDVDDDKRSRYLGLIDDELNRVNRLLNDMLVYGGRSRLELRRGNVLAVLRDAVERNDWSQYPIKPLVKADPDGEYMASMDAFKVGQVLDNILKNACEAVSARGTGRVVALVKDSGAAVEVRVVDSGTGVAPDVLPRLCTPMFSTRKSGNGFGLAISRKIMEAHGGGLFIDSVEGVYTAVRLVFQRDCRPEEECR